MGRPAGARDTTRLYPYFGIINVIPAFNFTVPLSVL